MAMFGSSWGEDSEDIGPFSHWLEDFESSDVEDNNSANNSSIPKSIKNKELKLKKPTRSKYDFSKVAKIIKKK